MTEQEGADPLAESSPEPRAPARTLAEVLELPDVERQLVNWLRRQGEVTLAEVAAHLGQEQAQAQGILAALVEQGFVRQRQVGDEVYFRGHVGTSRPRPLSGKLWQALSDQAP
jgi:predicted ArsR family transcriptional regulator